MGGVRSNPSAEVPEDAGGPRPMACEGVDAYGSPNQSLTSFVSLSIQFSDKSNFVFASFSLRIRVPWHHMSLSCSRRLSAQIRHRYMSCQIRC